MDLNAAKYPAEALYYTDIKSYEQGAGQHISKEYNTLPALSCLPINGSWFWKTSFPSEAVKDPKVLVNDNIVPFNNAYCNFILNVAPNRDGLIDDNALKALAEIGSIWKNTGTTTPLPKMDAPIIASNLAKNQPCNSSWSNDMWIMDFANDDSFKTGWESNVTVKNPWYEVVLKSQTFNMIVIAENKPNIKSYSLEYFSNNKWNPLFKGENSSKIKVHRFEPVKGDKVRISIDQSSQPPVIMEFQVYNEKR